MKKLYLFIINYLRKKPKISPTGGWIGYNEHYLDEELVEAILVLSARWSISSCNDLGSGSQAKYALKLHGSGIGVSAFDYNREILKIREIPVKVVDLTQAQIFPVADLTLCLEVGEHIPENFCDVLIDNISSSTRQYLILSWAILGQAGVGHVNCKTNFEVIYTFQKRGFKLCIDETKFLRENSSLPWFKNSLFVFEK